MEIINEFKTVFVQHIRPIHHGIITSHVSAIFLLSFINATNLRRYVIDENVKNTGVALFAIFDGHGGDYAADFAKQHLIPNINAKIADAMGALRGITNGESDISSVYRRNNHKSKPNDDDGESATATDSSTPTKAKVDSGKVTSTPTTAPTTPTASNATQQRRSSFKKSYSTAEDCGMNPSNCNREQDIFLDKLNAIIGGKNGGAFLVGGANEAAKAKTYDGRTYIEQGGTVNFGKMMVDEVLAADDILIEQLQQKVGKLDALYSRSEHNYSINTGSVGRYHRFDGHRPSQPTDRCQRG